MFDPNESKPKFFWGVALWEDYVNGDVDLKQITHDARLKTRLQEVLIILSRHSYDEDDAKAEPNESIASILATKPAANYRDWKGTTVAYGRKGRGFIIAPDNDPGPPLVSTGFRDLDMTDFSHLVHHFLASRVERSNNFQAVQINSTGDMWLHGRPKYEYVQVLRSDIDAMDISSFSTFDIADLIGIPLYAGRVHDPKMGLPISGLPTGNRAATFLTLCCDPASGAWGRAPKEWQDRVGSVIVFRKDRMYLYEMHLEAIAKYCRYEVGPLMEDVNRRHGERLGNAEDEDSHQSLYAKEKEEVTAGINRESFEKFWMNFQMEKGDMYTPTPYFTDPIPSMRRQGMKSVFLC